MNNRVIVVHDDSPDLYICHLPPSLRVLSTIYDPPLAPRQRAVHFTNHAHTPVSRDLTILDSILLRDPADDPGVTFR